MDRTKTSKKALRSLINDSMRDAIGRLELPAPSKKVKKLLDRNAKKLATVYAEILKREDRQRKKAEKNLVASIKGKTTKSKKSKVKAEALTV
jgi:hypothetical protein